MRIDARYSLILAIDIQDRLLGTLPEPAKTRLLHNSSRLLAAAAALDIPRMATAQYPQGLGPVREDIQQDVPTVMSKTVFSAWRDPAIQDCLKQRDERRQIILAGVETHICILQTALDLQMAGFQPVVVADACASRHDDHAQSALCRLRQAGVSVAVAESVFYEWVGDAAHPLFRKLAPAWR